MLLVNMFSTVNEQLGLNLRICQSKALFHFPERKTAIVKQVGLVILDPNTSRNKIQNFLIVRISFYTDKQFE